MDVGSPDLPPDHKAEIRGLNLSRTMLNHSRVRQFDFRASFDGISPEL